ncbi:MAG: isoleucine--tRNA ligase [Holosporales bacterium]|jgi:isoleucyl-tRNA synthetase|nr:isoleucine--tRNA ligase [Holosporales bacterium]
MGTEQNNAKQLKDTVFLPKTSFPMQGNLTKKEPALLEEWNNGDLYGRIRKSSKGRKKFILHFGPPYANGHTHIGHALIGILKDAVVKSYQMSGYDAPLVIGWDCHGLPIEWKIEESYLKQKKKREDVPVDEFMGKCREFAGQWVDIQREEFKKLGIISDFKNPYNTMDKESEAVICEKFFEIVKKGLVYRGKKPVMWSVVEKTALAEAELEYHDKVSDAIFVKFPIVESKDNRPLSKPSESELLEGKPAHRSAAYLSVREHSSTGLTYQEADCEEFWKGARDLVGAYVVIWTTTPWTIPGNKAIAYSPDFEYSVVKVGDERYIIAKELVDSVMKEVGISDYEVVRNIKGADLAGIMCDHPLKNLGFPGSGSGILLVPAHHVTIDTGTGLVHTAPAHGVEDFMVAKEFNLPVENVVNDDGTLSDTLPYFQGEHVFKVNPKVIEELRKTGNLLHASQITHSYPHSWRSKAPLIFRTTSQWFISISDIREKLLSEVNETKWFPSWYVNRIRSMVEKRPDWCVSRQRIWGVPIALFINKKTDEILMDEEVFIKIAKTFREEGIEAWHNKPADYFLCGKYNPDEYTKVSDTLEVWFDSACSHHYVLESRDELSWPADLYFEGSDQHRGWFQSSLVESVCTTGKAPYRHVATNGFVLDKDGKKMSKSVGNVVSPDDVINKFGADILRLWCLNSDYSEDTRIGDEILIRQQDVYRRFRNTLRYLLGVISCYDPNVKVEYNELPDLEKLILHQLYELDALHKESIAKYEFQRFCSALHSFCSNDLSAFYFDIRKDSVYCDAKDDIKRMACINVMNEVFVFISHWLAPILSFTSEEAWLCYPLNSNRESIHLNLFPTSDTGWNNPELASKWQFIREIRKSITSSIEVERAAKTIGSSLETEILIYSNDLDVSKKLMDINMAEITIVSKTKVINAQIPHNATYYEDTKVGIVVAKAAGSKCDRCWKVSEDTASTTTSYGAAHLCPRCKQIVL